MHRELRFALRSLWRSKAFALTALLVFSLGIAATSTVFSIIDAVLLRPTTFPNPESVVAMQAAEGSEDWHELSPFLFDRVRSRTDVFSKVVCFRVAIFTVTRIPVPDQVLGLAVSGNYFSMAGAHPWRGRILLPEDDKPGAPAVALLSYKGWRNLFNSDPDVVSKVAEIDGQSYTIIGIMPSDFVLSGSNGQAVLWTTLRLSAEELAAPNARNVHVFARRQPSVRLSQAQAAMDTLVSSLPPRPDRSAFRLRVSEWHVASDADQKLALWLAMGTVAGLLIIACTNLASIQLARAIGRRRDYAIRLAIGASRMRLISQSLLEVGVLASISLVVACAATSLVLKLIRDYLSAREAGIPDLARIQVNGEIFLFSFGVALLAALMCGLVPALAATSIDLSTGLREFGTQARGGRSSSRFLHSLLAVEAGISMVLLITSGVLVRSLTRLMYEDHGLQPDHVLTLHLPTGSWQLLSRKQSDEDRHRRILQYLELMRQAEAIHGVQAVALSSVLPLSHVRSTTHLQKPHQAAADESLIGGDRGTITQSVTGDYFRAMGIPLLSGRTFEPADGQSKRKVALLNQTFVNTYFDGENPIGKLLYSPDTKESIEVIGVVKDSPHLDFAERVEPELYIDFEQSLLTPFLTGLVVRAQGDPELLGNALRRALSANDAGPPVVHIRTLQSLIDENVWTRRFSSWLFSGFSCLALCLSGIGIYGVVAYITTARRRDFGIRLALGSEPAALVRLAAVQGLTPVVIGIGLGVLGSYWTTKWIATLLYKTQPLDIGITLTCIAVLAVLALAAVAGPALRASRVDPAITLRSE